MNERAYPINPELKLGAKVWWADPDNNISSGFYEICEIQSESGLVDESDTLISIKNDAGSHAEVFAHELEISAQEEVAPIVGA